MTSYRKLTVRNDASELAPAYGIAEISDAAPVTDAIESGTADSSSVLVIRKPTGAGRVVAIGPCDIPYNADPKRFGTAFTGDCFVRFTGSDPSPGDTLRATAGSWALSADGEGTGVTVAGDIRDMGDYKIVRVEIGGGSTPGGIQTGRVASSTPAVFSHDGDVEIPGEVEVWLHIPRSSVAAFDDAENYLEGNFVLLTADAYDSGASYTSGDLTLESGNVYKANTTTTGTFDSGDWDLLDPAGIKRANTTVSAGDYDTADWDDVPDDATKLIDRNQETVTWEHDETDPAGEGALVKRYPGGELAWMSCSAPDAWVVS